jgi:hypothetical protein
VPTEAGDPAAEAQAGSALVLEEVIRPTVQLASSAGSPRALFAEFGGRFQVGELPTDVNGAVAVGADALGERVVSIVTKLLWRGTSHVGMSRSRWGLRFVRGWLLHRAPRGQRDGWLASARQSCFRVLSHHAGSRSLACSRARGGRVIGKRSGRGTQVRRRLAAGGAGAGRVVPPPRIRRHVYGADDRRSQRRRAGC